MKKRLAEVDCQMLKRFSFPQPQPESGQYWWLRRDGEANASLYLVRDHVAASPIYAKVHDGLIGAGQYLTDIVEMAYCPDGEEIVKHIKGELDIERRNGEWVMFVDDVLTGTAENFSAVAAISYCFMQDMQM